MRRPRLVGRLPRQRRNRAPMPSSSPKAAPCCRPWAPALVLSGATNRNVQFLGTGLWDDPAIVREPVLANGWFRGARTRRAFRKFTAHYRELCTREAPPRIATLPMTPFRAGGLLSQGRPYQRFTNGALTDPNGSAGWWHFFASRDDGSADRGWPFWA